MFTKVKKTGRVVEEVGKKLQAKRLKQKLEVCRAM